MPGDKSISHRYVLFGALASGVTTVEGLAPGADVASSIACVQALGAAVTRTAPGRLEIRGRGAHGLAPADGDLARHDREFERVEWIPFAHAGALLTFETERALVATAAARLPPGSGGPR